MMETSASQMEVRWAEAARHGGKSVSFRVRQSEVVSFLTRNIITLSKLLTLSEMKTSDM